MAWWQAVLLGLVEGITEYLPVSSTGHLILVQRAMGFQNDDASNAFAICIQAGAILAVLVAFWPRLVQMGKGVAGADPMGRRLAILVVVAFLPAAVIGKLFDDAIERVLFGLWPVVTAWLVGGIVLLAYPRARAPAGGRGLETLAVTDALIIGFAQCIALWPGTSRSLATILGALAVGLSMPAAVEFSFLLGLITLGAATAYKGLKSGHVMLETFGALPVAIGFVVAAVSAFIAVKWMIAWLNAHGLELFAAWRISLGLMVAGLLLSGVL